jgi:cytochrome c5
MLKPFLLISAVVMVLAVSQSAPAGQPLQTASAAKNQEKKNTLAIDKAKGVYNMDCALCHGASGDGKTDVAKEMGLTLVDWTDPKTLSDRLDEELFTIIRNGKGKMPAEDKGRASDDEVKNLIVYIRGLSKNQTAASPAPAAPPVATTPAAPNQ